MIFAQLVHRHEDLVRARVLELEVVARDVRDGLRLEAGEARDAVVLVHDDVAGAQLRERAQAAAAALGGALPAGALGAAPAEEAVLGDDRELQAGRDEPVAQRRAREVQRAAVGGRRLVRRVRVVEPRRPQAGEVVRRPLALAAAGERDDGAVAGADLLLERRLGLGHRARADVRRLGAELDRAGREDSDDSRMRQRSSSAAATAAGET